MYSGVHCPFPHPLHLHLLVFVMSLLLIILCILRQALSCPCVGIECAKELVDNCTSMHELALCYLRRLPQFFNHAGHVRFVGYSFGSRLAFHMACILEQRGQHVLLVLVDGPCGPDASNPPRLNGQAGSIAEVLREPNTQHQVHALGATLVEMPDSCHIQKVYSTTLYISCSDSAVTGNGTLLNALDLLQNPNKLTIQGDHFGLMSQAAVGVEIAAAISVFFENKCLSYHRS